MTIRPAPRTPAAPPYPTEASVPHLVRVDHAVRRAWLGEQLLALGEREYDLLALLVQEPDAVPFEHLTRSIYGEPLNDRTRRMVHELAGALRRKLSDRQPYQYIVSVYGLGLHLPEEMVAPAVQRVEIEGAQYNVLHWDRQPARGTTEVFTLYARPAEAVATHG